MQGFDYAINNKFNLIDLLAGADPRFLEPQVKAAEAAGLKVVAAHLTGYEQPIPGGVTGVVPIDYKRAGALLADWAIWKTDGKANAVVVGINDVLSTDSMMSGIKEEFAKCANCKIELYQRHHPGDGDEDADQCAVGADRRTPGQLRDPDL